MARALLLRLTMIIQKLSDDQLSAKVKLLRQHENEVLIELLEHIQEVERRRLHLRLGYSSMYKYLTEELKYSEHEAYTRIETARFIKQVPSARDDIASGDLSLSAVTEIRSAVKEEEKRTGKKIPIDVKVKLAEESRGCSRREVQRNMIERFAPSEDLFRERIRQVKDGWLLELILNSDQKFSLERAKDILAHLGPLNGYSDVVSRLTEHFLRKKDLTLSTQHFFPGEETAQQTPPPPKRISIGLRRAIFRRDQGRCQYRRPDGKICGSTYEVELDHIQPLSKGGKNVYVNLRCMCRAHNQYKSDRPAEPGAGASATVN